MATFPILSKAPALAMRESYDDPTISSKSEFGYVFTRPRSSKVPRIFALSYEYAPQSDHDALDAFIRTTVVGTSGAFDWEDPRTGEIVTVRFTKLPEFEDAGYATQKSDPNTPEVPIVSGKSYKFSMELTEV